MWQLGQDLGKTSKAKKEEEDEEGKKTEETCEEDEEDEACEEAFEEEDDKEEDEESEEACEEKGVDKEEKACEETCKQEDDKEEDEESEEACEEKGVDKEEDKAYEETCKQDDVQDYEDEDEALREECEEEDPDEKEEENEEKKIDNNKGDGNKTTEPAPAHVPVVVAKAEEHVKKEVMEEQKPEMPLKKMIEGSSVDTCQTLPFFHFEDSQQPEGVESPSPTTQYFKKYGHLIQAAHEEAKAIRGEKTEEELVYAQGACIKIDSDDEEKPSGSHEGKTKNTSKKVDGTFKDRTPLIQNEQFADKSLQKKADEIMRELYRSKSGSGTLNEDLITAQRKMRRVVAEAEVAEDGIEDEDRLLLEMEEESDENKRKGRGRGRGRGKGKGRGKKKPTNEGEEPAACEPHIEDEIQKGQAKLEHMKAKAEAKLQAKQDDQKNFFDARAKDAMADKSRAGK